jgi:hypothetical protein
VPTIFEPGKTTSGMRWRWVLGVGAGVAALAFALIYLTVTLYAAALSVLSRGELDRAALDAALDRFADFMVAWGLPGLYLLLMVSGVSWLARRTLETNVWQGVTVGLVSATLLQVIGLAFGPPSLRELILYPLLGMAGGYLGGVVGRALLAEHEALYRTSRDIGAAANAQEVGAAIGRNLADAEQVSLWTMTPRTGDSGSLELLGVAGGGGLAKRSAPRRYQDAGAGRSEAAIAARGPEEGASPAGA